MPSWLAYRWPSASANVARMRLLDQIYGAAAETAAGEPRADQAGQVLGQFHHGIGLFTAGFEVLAVADVGFSHEATQFLQIVADQCIGSGHGAGVFGDDVAGALEGVGAHLRCPSWQIVEGGIAEEPDFGAMAGDHRGGFFHLRAAAGVFATGDGVLAPWCWR